MEEADTNKTSNLNYKDYLEERKLLIDAEREQSRLFDKAILTLAGGAFGLSLTFIKDIVSEQKPIQICWLILAWICFCSSMLSTLISFLTSQKACSRQREIIEESSPNNGIKLDGSSGSLNKPAVWTYRLNVVSILTFITGAVFLSVFSIVNLLG